MTDELKEFEVVQEETVEQHHEIPEKFRGKSLDDVVKSYTELEKLHGRQSREMGELRKLADDLIMRSMSQPEPEKKEDPVDFFTDPDKYIETRIASDPRLAKLEQSAQAIKRTEVLSAIQKKHGDVESIVQDPEFQDWVTSSKVRAELFVRADRGLDFDAADELLSTWKERKLINNTAKKKEEQEEELRAGLSAGGSVKGDSGALESNGKVYRRTDIIRLQVQDPRRYKELLPEIRKAYADGRVR